MGELQAYSNFLLGTPDLKLLKVFDWLLKVLIFPLL
jgi:hypothetical protein